MRATPFLTILGLLAACVTGWAQVNPPGWTTNGLVAYYPFNGNADDASGNGRNGRLVLHNPSGITPGTNRFGEIGNSFVFGGSPQDYIDISSNGVAVLGSADRTFSAWINIAGFASSDTPFSSVSYIVSTGGGSLGESFSLRVGVEGQAAFEPYFVEAIGKPNQVVAASFDNMFKGWTHIVCVLSSGRVTIYVNGQRADSNTIQVNTQGAPAFLGSNDGHTLGFIGGMDDVRIYSRALTSDEVAALYGYESAYEAPSPAAPYVAPPAFGTAQVANGFVVGVKINDGGRGYTAPPVIRFIGGGGTGAAANAALDANGTVTNITMSNVGTGYTSVPIVAVEPPVVPAPMESASQAQSLVFSGLDNSSTYDLQVLHDSQFTSTGTAVSPSGTSATLYVDDSSTYQLVGLPLPATATAKPQIANGFVVGATVLTPGAGYTTAPTVTITDTTGTGAVLTATVSQGKVTGFQVNNVGSGYSSSATITLSAPPITGISPVASPTLKVTVSSLLKYFNYRPDGTSDLIQFPTNAPSVTATNHTQPFYYPMDNSQGFWRFVYQR